MEGQNLVSILVLDAEPITDEAGQALHRCSQECLHLVPEQVTHSIHLEVIVVKTTGNTDTQPLCADTWVTDRQGQPV
ncbi:hypothetical protein VTN00DRAFT_1847 [Thermoascus crustaceus]|uniref:uncharacterized protein n=1 Tax=Thermoascus crustaceus TaxID=5088 RepID=UPI00374482DA